MSIQKDIWVRCDKCGDSDFASHTAKQARAEARKYGWKNHGDIDLCPTCASKLCDKVVDAIRKPHTLTVLPPPC